MYKQPGSLTNQYLWLADDPRKRVIGVREHLERRKRVKGRVWWTEPLMKKRISVLGVAAWSSTFASATTWQPSLSFWNFLSLRSFWANSLLSPALTALIYIYIYIYWPNDSSADERTSFLRHMKSLGSQVPLLCMLALTLGFFWLCLTDRPHALVFLTIYI